MREAGVEGDGLTPPAGVNIQPAAINLITNGGFETNTTGWTKSGALDIATSAEQAKFGSQSLKSTANSTSGTANLALAQFSSLTLTAAAHVFSVWVYIPAGWTGGTVLLKADLYTNATGTLVASADMGLTDQWQRIVTGPFTPNAGALAGNFRLACDGVTSGEFIYVDGAQAETGSIATPYIETDGSTESRLAGRVSTDEIDIDSSQFAVAVRWNPGIANTALSTGTAVLFEKVVDSNNLIRGLYDWQNDRYELQRVESGSGSSHTKAHTFTAQSSQTVIFQGTPTGLTISTGGAFDSETANTATPDLSTADLDYGSSAGSSLFLLGNVRWASTMEGPLDGDDAAALASLPSNVTWAQVFGSLPSSAGVDTLWPCSTAQFFKAA